MYKIIIVILQFWLFGFVLMILYSLAALMPDLLTYDASKGHWPRPIVWFCIRIGLAIVWPISLATTSGRKILFQAYKGIN